MRSLLKNKHVITALLVTPLLAVGGYFVTDSFVKESPHTAIAGKNYPLIEKPNCRYSSGQCELHNGNFSLIFSGKISDGVLSLQLVSAHSLQQVKIAFGENGENLIPDAMKSIDEKKQIWSVTIKTNSHPSNRLFIVASSADAFYYGDTSINFLQYETSYSKDFR